MIPHSIEAEKGLLGAALIDARALEVLTTKTSPGDFYRPAHRLVADVLVDAHRAGQPADAVTTWAELEHRGAADRIPDGKAGLLALVTSAEPTMAERYAEIIADKAYRRAVMARARDLYDAARSGEAIDASLTDLRAAPTPTGLRWADWDSIETDVDLERAELLARSDGRHLLYAGRLHSIQSEPGLGKTWLALAAVAAVLEIGGAAVMLDYEDTARNARSRLLALGVADAAIRSSFHHLQPDHADSVAGIVAETIGRNPDLVVIDGVAEALHRADLDEDSNADLVTWIESLPRPLTATGSTVLLLDHVAKNGDNRGRYARGAGHKLAAIDGAAYELVPGRTGFSRTDAGSVRVRIVKDRPGAVGPVGTIAAVLHLEPTAHGAVVTHRLEAPRETEDTKAGPAPAYTGAQIAAMLDALEKRIGSGPISQRDLFDEVRARGVTGGDQALRAAVKKLANDGLVTQHDGPRRSHLYELPPRQESLEELEK